jgi:hypothetical protein
MLWAVMSFSIALCAITLSIEIHRISNYSMVRVYFLGMVDAKLFFRLNELLPLSPGTLLVLRNIGYGLFQTANLAFIHLFGKYTKHSATRDPLVLKYDQCKRVFMWILAAFIILYLIFYHPAVGYHIFLVQFWGDTTMAKVFLFIAHKIHVILFIFTYVSALVPVVYLLYGYKKRYVTIFFEHLLSRVLILLALYMMFFVVISEPMRAKWKELLRTGFWRGVSAKLVPKYNISVLPLLSFCLLLLIAFLLVRFQTANFIDYFKEYSIKKHLSILHGNLRDVLHSEKNVIFNMKILAQAAANDYGTPQGEQKLERLIHLCDSHLDSLTQSINSIKDFKLNTIKRDFTEAIEAALQIYPLHGEIKLVKNYGRDEVFCNYDLYHMTQIIINLLENAVDSLKNQTESRIELSVEKSDYWVLFSVCDNGCGIPPDMIRKIQKPYFSTKSKQNNWGIGLFYVQKVVKAHLGYMRIRSLQNEWTTVELLFMCV